MKRNAVRKISHVVSGFLVASLLASCQSQSTVPAGREIAVDVTDQGFEPAEVRVPAGEPVTLVLTRKTDQTCATEVVFQSLHRRYKLPLGRPVRIALAPTSKGTLVYRCGMDMLGGRVTFE
jgi:plastocyanin domain-containing protein